MFDLEVWRVRKRWEWGVYGPRGTPLFRGGRETTRGKRSTGLTARYSSCWLVKLCVQVCAHDRIAHPCDFAWLKLGCGMKADKRIRCDKLMAPPSQARAQAEAQRYVPKVVGAGRLINCNARQCEVTERAAILPKQRRCSVPAPAP